MISIDNSQQTQAKILVHRVMIIRQLD